MASVLPGSHTYNNHTASNHARQLVGDVTGEVHMGDKNYYGSSPIYSRDRCLAALSAADPKAVMMDIKAVKHSPLQQCYSWIEDDPNLRRWETDQACRLLRIGGDPGKGKTMLMISLVQKLEAMEERSPTTYFFCQSTDNRLNSATAVLQGLIWYLVASNPELGNEFDSTFRTRGEKPFCSPNADFAELSKLMSKLLSHPKATRINVLVDALDECDVDKDKLLRFIAEDSKQGTSKAKWLVSSRNHRNVEEALDSPDDNFTTLSLELNSSHVAQAVNSFIEVQTKELARKKGLTAAVKESLQQELMRKADATFLWVALVTKELMNVTARKILNRARAYPSTLTAFYGRMLRHLLDQDDEEDRALCTSIMRGVVLAQRPLSLAELGVVAGLPATEFARDEDISDLVRSCGSFVDIRDNTCYFVHQSAKDFFLDSEAGKGIFEEGLPAEHERVFCRSLDAMSRVLTKDDICSLIFPGSRPLNGQKILESPLWPIRYSCSFWVVHVELWLKGVACSHIIKAGSLGADVVPQDSCSLNMEFSRESAVEPLHSTSAISLNPDVGPLKTTIAARICGFLEKEALRWVEALALLSQFDAAITALRKLRDIWLETTDIALSTLVEDLQRVIMQCGIGIEAAPLQIYSSAIAFAPSKSTTRQMFKEGSAAWLTRPLPQVALQWDAALYTLVGHSDDVEMVTFSPDGRRVASCSRDKTVRLWDADRGVALHTLEGHCHFVEAVTFSPDGRQLASCSRDKTVRLWDTGKGVQLYTLDAHNSRVNAATFSPNGRRLASCSRDSTVRLWDADRGAALHTLEGHCHFVEAVTFSPDGRRLASCSWDKTVRLWDTDRGAALYTLEGHSNTVSAVMFSPDGRRLASCSWDKTVRLWDTDRGAALYTLEGHSNTVSAVNFSPDGRRLASCSRDSTVRLWDADRGAALHTLKGHSNYVETVMFSPDGRRLASCSWDKTVRLWDTDRGAALYTLKGHSNAVYAVKFSPDGRRLASCSEDKTVRLWDADRGSAPHTLERHGYAVHAVTFSPDGRRLASCSWDKTVRLWDADRGTALQMLEGHSDVVYAVTFSPDGRRLASCSDDSTVRLWGSNTGAVLHMLEGHSDAVSAVTFSPDGRRLASCSWDRTVRLWDTDRGTALHMLEGHSDVVYEVTFSPDGRRLASCSDDSTVRLWDSNTGAVLHTLKGHSTCVEAVTFSPDGRQLASCSWDKTVRLWDADTGVALHMLKGHSSSVSAVTFSPDGRRLASCSWDKTVRLWDADRGTALQMLEGHSDVVYEVTFSPDGRRLASGSWDGTIRLWDTDRGGALYTLEGHSGAVSAVTFSPDGRRLASGSWDGTVRLWDADREAALQTPEGHRDAVSAVTFSPDGRRLASCSWDGTVRLWDTDRGTALHMFEGHSDVVYEVTFSPDGRRLASRSWDGTVRLWNADTGNLEIMHDDGRPLYSHFDHNHGVVASTETCRPTDSGLSNAPISYHCNWILYGERKLLWIPVQYRPRCIAFRGSAVAVGCESGIVYRVSINVEKLPSWWALPDGPNHI